MYENKNKPTFDYCSNLCAKKSTVRALKISNSKLLKSDSENKITNDKRQNTMVEKYGVSYNSQRPDVKIVLSEKLSKSQICDNTREFLLNKDWLYQEYVVNKRTGLDIADELGICYSTVLEYCRSYGFEIRQYSNSSLQQKQIYEFILENYSGIILHNNWTLLGDLEIDIYLPEENLAIEVNGLYWHSSDTHNDKNKFRHITKTNRCEALSVQLLHIRSDQWDFKRDIIKSILKNKLGFCYRIYARKCSIVELNSVETKLFLTENHIQGNADSSIRLGLKYYYILVAVMTFSKSRFTSNYSWELVRYCNILDTTVIGGFSRLLKYFRANYEGSIISYCDRSRSFGDVYLKNNFKLIEKKIIPSYSWTDKINTYNRLQYTRKSIEKRLKFVDMNLTVDENMFNNKFRLIFDSGQLAFVL
jgi:hypothetical protein